MIVEVVMEEAVLQALGLKVKHGILCYLQLLSIASFIIYLNLVVTYIGVSLCSVTDTSK